MNPEKIVNGLTHRSNAVFKNADGIRKSISRQGHSAYMIIVDDNIKRINKSEAVKYVKGLIDDGFELIS